MRGYWVDILAVGFFIMAPAIRLQRLACDGGLATVQPE